MARKTIYTYLLVSLSFISGAAKKEEKKKKKKEKQLSEEKLEVPVNETINIFSIASGHLYERFLRLAVSRSSTSHSHTSHCLIPRLTSFVFLCCQDYDAQRPQTYSQSCQVLVSQKLPLPNI